LQRRTGVSVRRIFSGQPESDYRARLGTVPIINYEGREVNFEQVTMGGGSMKPNIGIADKNRTAVSEILNRLLSDEYVLYTKTRNYHWNVLGMQFNDLHKFFESQYEALDDIVDQVAERSRALGGESFGTLAEFSSHTRLKEKPGEVPSARAMLSGLLADHETVIRALRGDLQAAADQFGDMGTSDFLTGLMEEHEKMAWMLRSFLGGGK
jgi:starvation-inducible DNA-binding protein